MKRVVMVLLAGLALGCGDDSVTALRTLPALHGLVLAPKAVNIALGGTQQLTAIPKDTAGAPLENLSATFYSSDTTTVRISTTGIVTGVALGSAEITASVRSEGVTYKDFVTVTVMETPATLAAFTLDQEAMTFGAGLYSEIPVIAKSTDPDGNEIPWLGPPFFFSTDPTIVQVYSYLTEGYLRGMSPGQAKVIATITVNGVTKADTVTVTVTYPTSAYVQMFGHDFRSELRPGEMAAFSPREVIIAPGGSVSWTNFEENTFGVTFENPDAVEGGNIAPLGQYEGATRTFPAPGVYRYTGEYRYNNTLYQPKGTVTVK